jgi:hypothetical protein
MWTVRRSRAALALLGDHSPAAIESAGDEAGNPRDEHGLLRCGRGGDANHQARGGHDAVVGAEHRCAQPTSALG